MSNIRRTGDALSQAAADAIRVGYPKEPRGMKADALRRLSEAQAEWRRVADNSREAVDALQRYGRHDDTCAWNDPSGRWRCDCGYVDALNPADGGRYETAS